MQSSLPIRFPELQQASTGRVGNDLGESTATIPAALSVYQLLGTPHNKAMELRERSFSFWCMPHISFRVLASYERRVLPHKIGPSGLKQHYCIIETLLLQFQVHVLNITAY
jgi:hypothetical protein